MTDEIKDVEQIVSDHIGMRPTPATASRLQASIEERAAHRRVSVAGYVEVLREEPGERQELVDLITVQETSFFRDNAHFDALGSIVEDIEGPVVAWSAGCSTGQEAYSLGMAFDELRVPSWFVIASDLSTRAIDRTATGLYRERELRGLSTARRSKYLQKNGAEWQIVPEIKTRVRTVRHNLALQAPPVRRGECQIVFCRNVLIYLRRERIGDFVRRLADWIAPGGYLFLGMSEVLWDFDARFDLIRVGEGAFAYRRNAGGAQPRTRDLRQIFPTPPKSPTTTGRTTPTKPTPPKTTTKRASGEAPLETGNARVEGETAAREGRHDAAVVAFRKAIYAEPDDPLAHLQLGLSLEASGDHAASQRAYRAALAALRRADRATIEGRLEGYGVETLEELLESKLGDA